MIKHTVNTYSKLVPLIRVGPRGILQYTYSYNHAHSFRLEKLSYIGISRSSNGLCGGFRSETAVTKPFWKRLQIYNGYVTAIPQRTQVSVRA
jgi:hypothetical protein